MGSRSSKYSDEPLPVQDATSGGSEFLIESEEKYDKQVISSIIDEIKNHPDRFLMNNLLMSVVFFRNYEKDLYDFSNTAIPKEEQDLNSKLVTEAKKCIIPNVLLEKIQDNVIFWDGITTEKEQISQKTIYVVNDNIDVKDRNDQTFYTSIDIPGCQVEIEEPDEEPVLISQGINRKKENLERKGFLKLRVLKSSQPNMQTTDLLKRSISTISQNSKTLKAATLSEENVEECSDEYSTITDFKTPKSLNIVQASQTRDTLPESCFAIVEARKLNSKPNTEENDSDEEEYESGSEEEELENPEVEDDIEYVTYLSSKGFMEYFQNEVFPNTTGNLLGFSDREIKSAQAMPGCILCSRRPNGENIPFRVIPSVAIDWPSQAAEYIFRKSRRTIIDRRNEVIYKWPTNTMITELRTLNCVVIPRGCVMKRGENENSDIEWEIHFPKAERYLQLRMTHPQVRCYLFLLALYKTFIQKFTTYHGLLIEHLRTHMFWECEKDAKNWPEHKMGNKILQVIEDLNSGLSVGKIPHYFIKEKNIVENIPSKYLQFAQKAFHEILEFPVLHFFKALKNLKYVNSDFYPTPDLDHLYSLLTRKNIQPLVRTRNKQKESKKIRRPVVQVGSTRHKTKPKIKDLKWKQNNEKKIRRLHLNKQKQEEAAQAEAEKVVNEGKNLKLVFSDLDNMTKCSVLQFFVHHFLEIAKKSSKIGPKSQTLFYLKQAWYNVNVLEDLGGVCTDTKEIKKTILKEQEHLEKELLADESEIAPPTPQRNLDQNAFVFHLNNSGKGGPLKTSFKSHSKIEAGIRRRERMTRPKSVGFDDNVEKILL